MPETSQLPVLSGHMHSLRSKTPDHSALVFYMTQILDAVENVAMLADMTPAPIEHLENWTCYITQRAAALELAVIALKDAQAAPSVP